MCTGGHCAPFHQVRLWPRDSGQLWCQLLPGLKLKFSLGGPQPLPSLWQLTSWPRDHMLCIVKLSDRGGSPSLNWLYMNEKKIFYCIKATKIASIDSVQFSHSVVFDSLQPHESQHARPPCPSPTPRAHPNSCASSQWCHPAISSSVVPFSSCPQSLPASGFLS